MIGTAKESAVTNRVSAAWVTRDAVVKFRNERGDQARLLLTRPASEKAAT
jgi:hypothetical protein